MLALEFPPINELIRWRDIFSSFNKVGLIAVFAALIGIVVFLLAGRKDPLVAPTGVRNLAESSVNFIENDIVMQTMGKDGLPWTPFLLSLFIFVYLCNLPGIIPVFQMPATARMAIPLFLALSSGSSTTRSASSTTASSTSPDGVADRVCRWECARWSASSSCSPTSSCAPSRWPSDFSPTCSPVTCC